MNSPSTPASVQRISHKVCLLGDPSVGKTSLVRRFVHDRFDDTYLSTIGVKVSRKQLYLAGPVGPTEVSLVVWDLAGGEPLSDLRRSYLRGSSGALLVADLTRPDSLSHLRGYADDLREVCPGARMVLLVNKADLQDSARITQAEVEPLARDLQMTCFTTSAKTGQAVETAFRHLGQLLVEAPASAERT